MGILIINNAGYWFYTRWKGMQLRFYERWVIFVQDGCCVRESMCVARVHWARVGFFCCTREWDGCGLSTWLFRWSTASSKAHQRVAKGAELSLFCVSLVKSRAPRGLLWLTGVADACVFIHFNQNPPPPLFSGHTHVLYMSSPCGKVVIEIQKRAWKMTLKSELTQNYPLKAQASANSN